MSRDAEGGIALLVGLVTLRVTLANHHPFYVKAGMRPLLIAAGVILCVLGGATLWLSRAPAADPTRDLEDEHGGPPRAGWLLLLPMLALVLIAPRPLGAFAAARQPARPPPAVVADDYERVEETGDGPVSMTITEFVVRALYETGQSLDGITVRLTGFVTPDPSGQGYLLTRFALSCCAADARPMQVRVIGLSGEPPAPDTWLEVDGTWRPTGPLIRSGTPPPPEVPVPELQLVEQRQIEAPAQPYEY